MECFEHTGVPAIGICKSCNKAACKTCAIIFPKGIACCEACAIDAKELVEMNERGKKLYGIGPYKSNKLASGVWIWLLLTVLMWLLAGVSYFTSNRMDYGTLMMAIGFSIVTAIVYRSSKRSGLQC
jgi:hypothetical protein